MHWFLLFYPKSHHSVLRGFQHIFSHRNGFACLGMGFGSLGRISAAIREKADPKETSREKSGKDLGKTTVRIRYLSPLLHLILLPACTTPEGAANSKAAHSCPISLLVFYQTPVLINSMADFNGIGSWLHYRRFFYVHNLKHMHHSADFSGTPGAEVPCWIRAFMHPWLQTRAPTLQPHRGQLLALRCQDLPLGRTRESQSGGVSL